MKFLPLVWAALRRQPLRSILTVLAVGVAFLLFGVMHGVIVGFEGALEKMSATRLRVMSRANILEPLPFAHGARIGRISGVRDVAHASIVLGYYQDPKNAVTAAALDVPSFLRAFPELEVPADQLAALLTTRTGAVAGKTLADRYGWKVGDRVALISPQWIRDDGSSTWDFDLVAIANGGPDDDQTYANELYFHYAFLDESRIEGKGTVHQFVATIDDPTASDAIAQTIDAEFANSADETTTLNDREYVRSQIRQVGDVQLFVNSILAAVLFTLLFLTGNTMMQSVRERIPELAVLKSIGFSDAIVLTLVLTESLLLCFAGAALGLLVAAGVFPGIFQSFGVDAVTLPLSVYAEGLAIAALLAVFVAGVPSWRARRLSIVDGLAGR